VNVQQNDNKVKLLEKKLEEAEAAIFVAKEEGKQEVAKAETIATTILTAMSNIEQPLLLFNGAVLTTSTNRKQLQLNTEKFDGETLADYRQFIARLDAKFRIDVAYFKIDPEKI
jgi:hypothetical protein